jgi:hypothetical protein
MTANDFRKLALGLPGTVEAAHMNHPDFRVGGKIFATLGYPSKTWGMVKLTPAQQRKFIRDAPDVFDPCSGAWGRQGATAVNLRNANRAVLREALTLAWTNTAPKRLVRATSDGPATRTTERPVPRSRKSRTRSPAS